LNQNCCPNHPSSAFPRYRRTVLPEQNLDVPKDADENVHHPDAQQLEELKNDVGDELYAKGKSHEMDDRDAKQSFKYLNSKTECSTSGKRGTCSDAVKTFEGTFSQFEEIIKKEESRDDQVTCEDRCKKEHCKNLLCSTEYKKCIMACGGVLTDTDDTVKGKA